MHVLNHWPTFLLCRRSPDIDHKFHKYVKNFVWDAFVRHTELTSLYLLYIFVFRTVFQSWSSSVGDVNEVAGTNRTAFI